MKESERLLLGRRAGSRYIAQERDGSWGVAAKSLRVLMLRLRGGPLLRIYEILGKGRQPVTFRRVPWARIVKEVPEEDLKRALPRGPAS